MKNQNLVVISDAISQYLEARRILMEKDVIFSQRLVASDLGEWLIAELFDGKIAQNKVQKDWDVCVGNGDNQINIQVKTHAKATSNKARRTPVKYTQDANIQLFIILVFDDKLKLKRMYRAPWSVVFSKVSRTKNPYIRWADLEEEQYIVDIESLPKQEIVNLFK